MITGFSKTFGEFFKTHFFSFDSLFLKEIEKESNFSKNKAKRFCLTEASL